MEYSDPELADKVKKDKDDLALSELIVRHSGIYVNMVKRFGSKGLTHHQIGDILEEKDFNIYMAAMDYDSSRSKFSTYLANKTKYLCLTTKQKNIENNKFTNFDDINFCQKSEELNPSESCIKQESYERIFNLLDDQEDSRIKTIFLHRYFSTSNKKLTPWDKVAKKMSLSIQGCINIHNKALKELQKKITYDEIKL